MVVSRDRDSIFAERAFNPRPMSYEVIQNQPPKIHRTQIRFNCQGAFKKNFENRQLSDLAH